MKYFIEPFTWDYNGKGILRTNFKYPYNYIKLNYYLKDGGIFKPHCSLNLKFGGFLILITFEQSIQWFDL